MRLLALADQLRGLAPSFFLVREPTPAVADLVAQAGWALTALLPPATSLEEANWLAHDFLQPSDVLVLDGYEFAYEYQQRLRQSGCGLVYVDDLRAWPVVADVLINHSPGVAPADYEAPPAAQLLLGPAFSLLRRPFVEQAAPPLANPALASVLVCFGGADPLGLTARTLASLLALPQVRHIGLLVGAAFGDEAMLREAVAMYPEREIQVHRNLSAAELVALLHAYDVAVVPASTVLIEALALGRPALTGYYADNQQALASYVHTHQQAFSVGNFADLAGEQLTAALGQGLAWLASHQRQPYALRLRPDILRQEIKQLLDR